LKNNAIFELLKDNIMKRSVNILLLSIMPFLTFAQNSESNDFLGNIGKIYVVVGVLMIIFFIMIGFLINLERKVKKLEDQYELED
jgi:branched-subunit amino acid transport protein AzlD